jgi:hypothetical protein
MSSVPFAIGCSLLVGSGCCKEVTSTFSDTNEVATWIVASDGLVAAAWTDSAINSNPGRALTGGVATFTPAGELVGIAEVPGDVPYHGVAGTTTSLWYGVDDTLGYPTLGRCQFNPSGGVPLVAALVADDVATLLSITMEPVTEVCATYDGSAYQVFWRAAELMGHRTVFEDGTLGPVHASRLGLFMQPFVVFPASDHAGATYLLVAPAVSSGGSAFVVRIDTATGDVQPVWTEPADANWSYGDAFFFAGALQLSGGPPNGLFQIQSIDPGTGVAQTHALDSDVGQYASYFDAGATRIVAPTRTSEVLILDESFTIIDREPTPGTDDALVAVIGADYVRIDSIPMDTDALKPGRLEVARRAPEADAELWRGLAATNSEVIARSECLPQGCGQVAPGAGLGTAVALFGLGALRRRRRGHYSR